jgi:hypothetical protein
MPVASKGNTIRIIGEDLITLCVTVLLQHAKACALFGLGGSKTKVESHYVFTIRIKLHH